MDMAKCFVKDMARCLDIAKYLYMVLTICLLMIINWVKIFYRLLVGK